MQEEISNVIHDTSLNKINKRQHKEEDTNIRPVLGGVVFWSLKMKHFEEPLLDNAPVNAFSLITMPKS